MPVTVVVGGQYGSEGKGKVAHILAKREGASFAVRVGGPNSGHTVVTDAGERLVLRQLPTAALLPDVVALLPAGSYIDLSVLSAEVARLGLGKERLFIHPNACVITRRQVGEERAQELNSKLGSTETGTGAAVRARIWRQGDVLLARDCPSLTSYVWDYSRRLRDALSGGERIIVEGTQGFGLSVLHGPHYPFATSRDTTAAAFVSEAGLSPLDVDDVVLVLRSYPIRVAGHSGPLPHETTWQSVSKASGSKQPLTEYTSVTNRVRRVAKFDPDIVKMAIAYNAPTRIAMNHLDYIDAECGSSPLITEPGRRFISYVEDAIGQHVTLLGTSPSTLVERQLRATSVREVA